jgi:hypothetical protein
MSWVSRAGCPFLGIPFPPHGMTTMTYSVLSQKPYAIELEIEGEKTVISYDLSKKILTLTHGQKPLLEAVKKDALKKHSVDVAGHAVEVFCRMPEALSIVPNEGLSVKVDGKPVQGSIADPVHQLNMASYALYALSAVFFMSLLFPVLSGETAASTDLLAALLVGILLVILGINLKRMPRLIIGIGSFIGCIALLGYVIAVANGQAGFGFSFILLCGSTLVLLQSFVFTLKKKHLPAD